MQDRHLGSPSDQPSDNRASTTSQSGPSARYVSVANAEDAPPGSWNPSFLSPNVSTLSEKRKSLAQAPVDNDRDDEADRTRTASTKRQCPPLRDGAGEAQDDVMFLPMPEQAYRFLFANNPGGLRGYTFPLGIPNLHNLSASVLPAMNTGTVLVPQANTLAIQGIPGAGSTAGSSQRPSGETPSSAGGGNGGPGGSGGMRTYRGRGDREGRGGDAPDGSDGDVESEGEDDDGGHRHKGKGRAGPRHSPTTFASSSDISNIRGDLRQLDGTMSSVEKAVSTFGSALVQMSDAQTMLVNAFVQNAGGPQPGNSFPTRLDKFARSTELDYHSRKADEDSVKLRGFPKARPEDQNSFAEVIRVATRERMGRATKKSPFVVEKIPTRADVLAWEEATPHCYACSWDDFRLDLQGTPHSAWNNSVIDVFVQGFIEHEKHPAATEKQIRDAFGTHVKSLISTYRRAEKGTENVKAWRKARKAYERQKNMHARRLAICYEHKGLEDAAKILMRLGVQGMSSDESEVDANNFKTYKVREKKWRNPQLADYLRVLDKLHRRSRTNPVTGNSQGAEVHRRKLTKTASKRGAVPRLPRCAYDQAWLDGLNTHDLDHLAPTDEQFSWEHTADIKNITRADNRPSDEPGTSYI